MRVKKITLKNVCCFEDLTIEISTPKDSGHWAVIMGDNGVGKTTVLRCIAMGLCGETGASALLRDIYPDIVRYQAKDNTATIRLDLATPGKSQLWIETKISVSESGEPEVRQVTSPKERFPWDEIFVCAYGAKRGGYASSDIAEYSPVDSVYSLFNYDSPLQNPELVLRRLGNTKVEEQIRKQIDLILMRSSEESTQLARSGIIEHGRWTEDIPFGGWGEGHRATFTLLVDFLGWAAWYDEEMLTNQVSGIVLIDEIEQHLHPSWQRRIIGSLQKQFPLVQFITTTNSPLCAAGTTDLPEDTCDLFLLRREGDSVKSTGPHRPPRGLRADQILTSYLFGLETTRSDNVVQAIERYSKLKSKGSLTQQEQQELNRLYAELNKTLGSAETELQKLVERALREAMAKLSPADLPSPVPSAEAIDFEIRRQLKELFS